MTIRFVPTHTESALEVVATERQRTSAERDAFDRFADRIAAFESASPNGGLTPESPATPTLFQADSDSDSTLARVRDTYCETVMNVPHYDEEYAESLREHLAMELSPDDRHHTDDR